MKVGTDITIVNNSKIEYLRCGKTISATNATVTVKLTDVALSTFEKKGVERHEFDNDDVSLMFVDQPGIPAPANTTTYGSLAIGAKNTVLRRCSMAVGKNNRTESDFCVALGRKAIADRYNSFVWAPAVNISAATDNSFTIGQRANLSTACTQNGAYARTIFVADSSGNKKELMEFICDCVKNDPHINKLMKDALGLS